MRSAIGSWQTALRETSGPVVLMSPFITSRTAESVVGAARTAPRVFTRFEAALFASGASRLGTLRALIGMGVEIRHLERLHAKIVLTPEYVAVGSQNLTRGGGKQREATATFVSEPIADFVRRHVDAWTAEAGPPITLEMISDMEEQVRDLRRLHKKFRDASRAADSVVVARARQREIEAAERARARREDAERERRREFAAELAATRPLRAARLHLRGDVGRRTLASREGRRHLTTWLLDGQPAALRKRNRFVVVDAESLRVAFVALNKTCLTQFATGIRWTKPIQIDGVAVGIEVTLPAVRADGANVVFKLGPGPHVVAIELGARFSPAALHFVGEPVLHHERAWGFAADLDRRARADDPALRSVLLAELLRTFRYDKNSTGVRPDVFLGADEWRGVVELRRHPYAQGKFFVLRR